MVSYYRSEPEAQDKYYLMNSFNAAEGVEAADGDKETPKYNYIQYSNFLYILRAFECIIYDLNRNGI